MGFVTNRWQPVSASPGPTPVPTWERIKNNVTASTAFDYSSYNYTDYLVLVHATNSSTGVTTCYEFFYIPEFGTISQRNGSQSNLITLTPTSNSTLTFSVKNNKNVSVTSTYQYTIYGRNKAAWSLVSDNSALPNYTELVTCNGYYTPFNYQDNDSRTSGGTSYTSASGSYRPSYSDYSERIYNNAYTYGSGNGKVYSRLSSTEGTWTHISSSTSSVSIAGISYSEMFIIGKKLFSSAATNVRFQALYFIPAMVGNTFNAGGYTGWYSSYTNRYTGSYGSIIISNNQIQADYKISTTGTFNNSFYSLDIYYR